ncbi:glucose-6-phosphatase [Hyposmocoma kahamanoa]|uniref:glucose-6-phosphatase n=1 Tax=Hyposmocoma kahamanoa TaxID=1477025 RepID=UPI000E6D8709|nr:glucose-6-phosphatase [Hyposmocoma kahamanoa]
MEQLYAVGITIIEFIQDWFSDSEGYFEMVNDISNPNRVMEFLFPIMSIVDSVFAAQLLLCMAFGGWLNSVLKWWLLEDRPYWWVRETDFYDQYDRPSLRQTRQTCETGPGCPSGHSETTAMLLVLVMCWVSHIMNDRNYYVSWWKFLMYPTCGMVLVSVMLARLFVGTHFPHQVVLGALVGAFLAPALCIYVSDPFIWQYGAYKTRSVSNAVKWHVLSAICTIVISVATYYGLKVCRWDPMWTVKLAFRWCEAPEHIHVSTTPMYNLVQATGYLLGWALWVTPKLAEYRHYTANRSLLIASFAVCLLTYILNQISNNICKGNALWYYAMHFVLYVVKPGLYLRLVPELAMWPYPKVQLLKNKSE